MENKKYRNISIVEALGKKRIIARNWYDYKELDPKFDKCDSQEAKNKIRNKARYIYRQLINGNINKFTTTIDSAITGINYYGVTYDTAEMLDDGSVFNERENLVEYEYTYNPYYHKKLIKELQKLARKDNMFLSFSLYEDRVVGSFTLTVSALPKEHFEKLYDISLEKYYEIISEKTRPGKTRKETLFRQELARLKSLYIQFMISYIDKGLGTADLETDAYHKYLQIEYLFSDIPDKDKILKEFDFVPDPNNHTLRLSNVKGHQPVNDK